MEERNVFCNECGTENEPQYVYCKNCGATLEKKSEVENTVDIIDDGKYIPPVDDFFVADGIPPEEMMSFIGKNAILIMRKFEAMRLKNTKISWCWPAAILGFFFGPFGAALWFFYRKVQKVAWALVAIGIISSFVTGAITLSQFPVDIPKTINEAAYAIQTAPEGEEIEAVDNVLEPFYEALETYENEIATAISDAVTIGCAVLSGMFAFSLYKRKAIETIYSYRQNNTESKYFHFGLATIGGTSSSMVALGILLMVFLPVVISVALVIFILF